MKMVTGILVSAPAGPESGFGTQAAVSYIQLGMLCSNSYALGLLCG